MFHESVQYSISMKYKILACCLIFGMLVLIFTDP